MGPLDPLGSQDSLVLDDTGSLLLVVNAGSNQVSSLSAGSNGLRLLSTVSSNGSFPNSVALNGTLAYVLNAHGTPNIAGFRVMSNGTLHSIPESVRQLPGGAASNPHDIRFTQDGTRLLVTEGNTNKIDIFEIGNDGRVTRVVTQSSAGLGPFGFRFGREGILLNAEANSDSVSSYVLTSNDMLHVISGAVPDTQQATCWISITGTGRVAFVSNTASGTLSSYEVGLYGQLTLANPVAASFGTGRPIDSAFSDDSAFLYVDDSAVGRIFIFRVQGTSLTHIGTVDNLPQTLQGIAAQ